MNIINILIVFMVIAAVLGAVSFLIYLIVRLGYKKKLNKRLQEDNGLIAEGKIPEHNRNHIAEPSFMIPIYILLTCLICIVTINFVTLFITLSDTKDINSDIHNEMYDIQGQLEDLQDAIKDINNPIRNIEYEPNWTNFDNNNYTVPVTISISLKTWSAYTIVSLNMDKDSISSIYQNGVYKVTVNRNIFDETSHEMSLVIETNGTFQSVELSDDEFTSIDYIMALGYLNTSFQGGFRLDYNSLKKQYEVNKDFKAFELHYKGGLLDSTIVSAHIAFYKNDELVVKTPITFVNNIGVVEKGSMFPISGNESDKIIMEESYTTSLGYIVVIRELLDDDITCISRSVYSSKKKLLYSENNETVNGSVLYSIG